MSERVLVQDGRQPPFLWCSLAAMRHLRATIPAGPARFAARSVYVGLAELAAERYDGQHAGFEATRAEIAGRGGMSDRRVGDHLENLDAIGLVEITTRHAESGAQLSSLYRLTEPEVSREDAIARLEALQQARVIRRQQGGTLRHPPDAASSPGGDAPSDAASPPTRASRCSEEVKEEGEREGARTHARGGGKKTAPSPAERDTLSELDALAAERGLAHVRDEVLATIRDTPGIDHLAAAQRLRKAYGQGGKASRRPIANLPRLFATELSRSTPVSDPAPRPPRARRGAAPGQPISAYQGLRVHAGAPPAGMTEPGPALEQHWQRMKAQLQASVSDSTWELWLKPLALAGEYTTLTTDLDDPAERGQRTLVLRVPADMATWIGASFHRLLEAVVADELGDGATVELTTPREANAA